MTVVTSPNLAEQIAAIEARGSGRLRAAQRRDAVRCGLRAAFPASLPVPAFAFVAGWVAPLPLQWFGITGVLVPLAVFGTAAARHLRAGPPERQAALALFDQALTLKDRVRMSDEFLQDARRDPFREAALIEAAPWIRRAAEGDPAIPAVSVSLGRRWWLVAAALVLSVGCVLQQALVPAGVRSGAVATRAGTFDPRGGGVGGDRPADSSDIAGGSGVAATGIPSSRPAPGSAAGMAGAQEAAGGRALAERGQASAADGFDPRGAQGGASMAAATAGAAQQRLQGGRDGSVQAGSGEGGGARQPMDRAGGQRDPAAGGAQAQRSGSAPQMPQGGAAQSPSASPLGSQQRAQQGQSGNGNRPGQQSRSQQAGQDQSQSGAGKGQGRDGQRSGQDALKRANGVAALLLAVPMADRLGGTVNPGLVSSLPRPVPPHAGAAGPATAGDRGQSNGPVGRVPHSQGSPQARRLLRDYFRRSDTVAAAGTGP